MKQRTIVSLLAVAGAAWWLAHRGTDAPKRGHVPDPGTVSLELFGVAKDRLDDARAAFAAHDVDRARRALTAATALTPAMEHDAPALGSLVCGRIVEDTLDLLDAHPELDAAGRREILSYAEVTPSHAPGVSPRIREELERMVAIHDRLAAAKRAVE